MSLHGGVPSRQRGALIEKFKNDPDCKVFLSTDAGGVGLNLQAASAVVNFEPPWNPARLEQRIGRVHRLGQSRAVHVIHMLTSHSIEERVWETLKVKKSLFDGVFDSPTGEVSFEKLRKKSVLQVVKEIFAEQPERPKPVIDPPAPAPLTMAATPESVPAPAAQPETDGIQTAAAGLFEAGIKFLESISSGGSGGRAAEASGTPMEQVLSGLFKKDATTNRPVLSIPLPESINQERVAAAITGLVGMLGRAFAAGAKG